MRSAARTLWVVNSEDWVDVEYVLRRLLRCESTDCHAFHSIGYVFFRSCAVSHVGGGVLLGVYAVVNTPRVRSGANFNSS